MTNQREKISVHKILQDVWGYYINNWISLAFLFVVIAGPFVLASSVVSSHLYVFRTNYELAHPEMKWISLGYSFLYSYLPFLVSGLGYCLFISHIISHRCEDDGILQRSLLRSLFPTYKRIGALFVLWAVVELIIILGMILFIVPGVILFARYSVSVPAMIAEKIGIAKAMQRSEDIAYGNKTKIIVALLVVSVITFIISYIPYTLVRLAFPQRGLLFEAFIFVVTSLTITPMPLAVVFLYHELKRIERNAPPVTDAVLIQEAESYKDNLMKPM